MTKDEIENRIKRTDLWNEIYKIIDQLPITHSGEDSIDKPSATTQIENLLTNHIRTALQDEGEGEDEVNDALKFILDELSEDVQLRKFIDSWCIKRLGNTEDVLNKADEIFSAAIAKFYKPIELNPLKNPE